MPPHAQVDPLPLRPTLASALGGVLLVAALVLGLVWAWNEPTAAGRYAVAHGRTLLGEGRYSEALDLLSATLAQYNAPDARLALSYAYLARRDSALAERQARLALDDPSVQNPATPAAATLRVALLSQLGRVLRFEGRAGEAATAWEEAWDARFTGPNAALPHARSAAWHLALLHWSSGDWDAARSLLGALLDGGDDAYSVAAGVKLAELDAPNDPEQALGLLAGAQDDGAYSETATPDLNIPLLPEGLARPEVERIAGMVRSAVRAAEGAGEFDRALLWGGAYLQMGEPLLARQHLEHAVGLDPRSEPVMTRLALADLSLGQAGQALAGLKAAVDLDPAAALPRQALARLYMRAGDLAGAKEQLDTLDRVAPGTVDLHLQWGDYYRLLGEYGKAEDEYIDAARLESAGHTASSVEAGEGINAILTLARFYTDARGLGCEKGLPAGQSSLQRHPGDPGSLDAVGWGLALCGQAEQAIGPLAAAAEKSPKVARYRYHLGRAYEAAGRYAEAREQYTRAMDLDPGGSLEQLALTARARLP